MYEARVEFANELKIPLTSACCEVLRRWLYPRMPVPVISNDHLKRNLNIDY